MSIWRKVYNSIKGGWKTHGPNASAGNGAFHSDEDWIKHVGEDCALRLSAVWACVNLRAEVIGSLPLHVYDKNKNIITDHPLYDLLHVSPNACMTAAEYWSLKTANVDMHGNAYSLIERRANKSVISLEPLPTEDMCLDFEKSGRAFYKLGEEKYSADRIFHLKGFTTNGLLGMSRLEVGRQILSSQIAANDSAAKAFKNGLKVGGFMQVDKDLTGSQPDDFQKQLAKYSLPENAGKIMTLLKGMVPVGGDKFRIKPAEAELLASRYMGIEEICRLYKTPPQLIGHSDKASSWASSLEQINLFYRAYGIQPDLNRFEQRIHKSLMQLEDKAKGHYVDFQIHSLDGVDLKSKSLYYASGLQNGYLNRDKVRGFEEMPAIPGGDIYSVQLNMTELENLGKEADNANKKP